MAKNDKYIIIPVNKFVDREIGHLKDKFDLKLESTIREMHKIESINDLKHISMNEVRDQLGAQRDEFATKNDLQVVEKDIKLLSKLIFIGLGIVLAVEVAMKFLFR